MENLSKLSSQEIAEKMKKVPGNLDMYVKVHGLESNSFDKNYNKWMGSQECKDAGELQVAYDRAVRREQPELIRAEDEAVRMNKIWVEKSAPRPITSSRQIGWHHGDNCGCETCRFDSE